MTFTPAKFVTSPQPATHKNLKKVVNKHRQSDYIKPIADHTRKAFDNVYQRWVQLGQPELVLDSACGTGESTRHLAGQYVDNLVVGLDQSSKRLAHIENVTLPENCFLQQCDCTDFWRLADDEGMKFTKHYLLYPNPYPKPKHLQRRWHAHSAFPNLISISQSIELRTNWKIYAEEFLIALQLATINGVISEYDALLPITAFERKYKKSGHDLWRVYYFGTNAESG